MRSELLHGSTAQKPDRGFAVCVLREDPGLCAMLDEPDRPAAVRAAIAPGFELACGAWAFSPAPDPRGALILGGLIVVRLQIGDRAHVELRCQGDVISLWAGGARLGPQRALRGDGEHRLAVANRAP